MSSRFDDFRYGGSDVFPVLDGWVRDEVAVGLWKRFEKLESELGDLMVAIEAGTAAVDTDKAAPES